MFLINLYTQFSCEYKFVLSDDILLLHTYLILMRHYLMTVYTLFLLQNHRNYLPTIDSHNQMSLRRRIVTQQLMKGYVYKLLVCCDLRQYCHRLSPILSQVGLTTQQVSGDIVAIVTTFNLQPANISFQPSLWTAVAAILLLLYVKSFKSLYYNLL